MQIFYEATNLSSRSNSTSKRDETVSGRPGQEEEEAQDGGGRRRLNIFSIGCQIAQKKVCGNIYIFLKADSFLHIIGFECSTFKSI